MTTQQDDLAGAYERAEAARLVADQAAAELHAAEHDAQRERDRRHRAAWQDFADQYDPLALRNAVWGADQNLRLALSESALGRALVSYQAAVMRESAAHDLALDATAAGATLPPGVTVPDYRGPRNATGEPTGGWEPGFITGLLAQAVFDAATTATDAEVRSIRDTTQAAYDSVAVPDPTAYKIVARYTTEDRAELIGAVNVHFAATPGGSVAYVAPHHPALHWFQQHELYDVQPVYAVPSSYQAAIQGQLLNPDLYRAGRAGQPGPEADPNTPLP